MALVLADRVLQTGTANTTVSFNLTTAVSGYQSFAVIGNGNTTYYGAWDGTNWEVGIGTYSTSGPILTRTTIIVSSNSNAAVSTFGSVISIFVTQPAEKAVYLDASGNASALGTISSGTWNATTIGTAYGGTGLTSFTVNGVVYASSTSALATGSGLLFDGSNLGLGVTPSAWTSGASVIQTKYTGSFYSASNGTSGGDCGMSVNQYINSSGNRVYLANGYASFFDQKSDTGAYRWFNAPSGTAGNTISFTQAMTLTNSNQLLVGTTSTSGSTTAYNGITTGYFQTATLSFGSLSANTATTWSGIQIGMYILCISTGGIYHSRDTYILHVYDTADGGYVNLLHTSYGITTTFSISNNSYNNYTLSVQFSQAVSGGNWSLTKLQ